MSPLVSLLIGFILGFAAALKLFPPSLVQNTIEQDIKKVKNSPGTIVDQTTPQSTEKKPRKFLGIFKRKNTNK